METQVLKPRFSLIGRSLIPVILKVKANQSDLQAEGLAKLKKDHLLSDYSLEELETEFAGLTGENLKDVLMLCGKEQDLENARILMHFTILQANIVGAPRRKALVAKASTSNNPPNVDNNASAPASSGIGTGNTNTAVAPHPDPFSTPDILPTGSRSSDKDKGVEIRLKEMEDKLKLFSNKSAESQVGESLAQVRILASRPNLTPSHVLLAAVESLVTIATKFGHKEAEFFSKAYTYCKKFEDSKDICNLNMKLFGSAEDKKLANMVAEWMKGKKYEASPKKTVKVEQSDKENNSQPKNVFEMPQNFGSMSNPASFGFPFVPGPMPMPPFFGPHGYSNFQGNFGNGRFNRRGRGGYSRRGSCLFCKEQGHYVA